MPKTTLQMDKTPAHECHGYDIKPSESEAPTSGTLENMEHPFVAIAPKTTLTLGGTTW